MNEKRLFIFDIQRELKHRMIDKKLASSVDNRKKNVQYIIYSKPKPNQPQRPQNQ